MIRVVAIAAVPLLLGGCLPLPVTIASSAISGISYLTTGKSSTDHVLSAAVEQDCNLTRPIVGKAVCRAEGPDDAMNRRVVVSYYPGDRDDGALWSSYDERLNEGAMDLKSIPQGPAQVAVVLPFARPNAPEIQIPGVVITQDAVLPEPEARPVAVTASARPWSEPEPIARDTARETTGLETYVVLGSVRDHQRARGLADRFQSLGADVRVAEIDGVTWNRVIVGPYAAAEAKEVRASLGTIDGKRPWVVRMESPTALASLY